MPTSAIAINSMALAGKLPPGDKRWYDFNQSFHNRELDVIDFADCIYMGHAYTSWHNPESRCSQNWQKSQFIAVDMDTQDRRSSLRLLRQNDLVMAFGTLIHTTPSHSAKAPRARVVFFLDRPIEHPAAYNTASKFLTELMGGDSNATDPSRFFYGCLNADIEVVRNILPVDYLYALYKRMRLKTSQSGRDGGIPTKRASYTQHDTTFEAKRQTILDALARIDPWKLDYADWCDIIAAIKYELSFEGLDIAEQWAQGKKGEVERMFRSFRRESGALCKMGTIIHHASLGH